LNGGGLNLAGAARLFPPHRGEKPVSPSTIFRWIMSGIRLADGRQIRLEARRVGGRWLTSPLAIQRFLDRQTPHIGDERPFAASRTPHQRATAAERAGRELSRVGI